MAPVKEKRGETIPAFGNASEVEVAWAAGLFEGEGCITWGHEGLGRLYARAQINMVDRDVVERFSVLADIGTFGPERSQQKRGWQQQWVWRASGVDAVTALSVLMPHFGERRRARATEVMDWYIDTYLKTCAECDGLFIALRRNAKYCGDWCRDTVSRRAENERRRARVLPPVTKICVRCGVGFECEATRSLGQIKFCPDCKKPARAEYERAWRASRRKSA